MQAPKNNFIVIDKATRKNIQSCFMGEDGRIYKRYRASIGSCLVYTLPLPENSYWIIGKEMNKRKFLEQQERYISAEEGESITSEE